MFLVPRNHPGLASSLVDFLRTFGPTPEQELRSLLIPQSLRSSASRGSSEGRWAGDHSFDDTVGAMIAADVLTRVEDSIALTETFRRQLGGAILAETLAPWLLSEERTGTDPSAGAAARGPTGDLAHALTWFMDLDPLGPWTTVTTSNP